MQFNVERENSPDYIFFVIIVFSNKAVSVTLATKCFFKIIIIIIVVYYKCNLLVVRYCASES